MQTRDGQFKVIDSFAIRRKNEFYLIGHLTEGTMQENWFLNIPFNNSLSMSVRILAIEEVEISGEENTYKLIIVRADNEFLDFLLALGIGNELVNITIDGKD
jgi:hypothetical protein